MAASSQTATLDALLDILADKIATRLQSPSAQPPAKLLSVKEAAGRMGTSIASIRHLISSGSIPQKILRRFGRRVLLDREEFDRWLNAH